MFALTDHNFFDLFERAGVNQNTACGNRLPAERAILVELDTLAIFQQKNFAGHDAELMGERGMTKKMTEFAMNGNEIFWLHELNEQFLLWGGGVAGNVDRG